MEVCTGKKRKSVIARQKMCVNEREASGTMRLEGVEVKKVHEFKY